MYRIEFTDGTHLNILPVGHNSKYPDDNLLLKIGDSTLILDPYSFITGRISGIDITVNNFTSKTDTLGNTYVVDDSTFKIIDKNGTTIGSRNISGTGVMVALSDNNSTIFAFVKCTPNNTTSTYSCNFVNGLNINGDSFSDSLSLVKSSIRFSCNFLNGGGAYIDYSCSNQNIINNGYTVGSYISTTTSGAIDVTNTLVEDAIVAGPTDPLNPGGISGTGGGTGTFDNTGDAISAPSLPTLSAVTAGFITLYQPTISQLNSLAEYMWSDAFSIDSFKKLFANPMDVIIGLSILPVAVPVSGNQEVKIGFVSTGVSMNLASSQYTTVNCGSIDLKEYWGSALDYSPYTRLSIYLPYIGTREIKIDDVMGKTIQVVYNIDILSGSCVAFIKADDSVLYTFSGACATSIPVTSGDWTQLLTSCIQLAGTGIVAAAGAAAPSAAASGEVAMQNLERSQYMSNLGTSSNLAGSTANVVNSMKPNVQRSGAVSGSAGMLGIQVPYLILERPRQSLAQNYNKYVGYPSNVTAKLGDLSGYTEIENTHLEGITATSVEKDEILAFLKSGVIL